MDPQSQSMDSASASPVLPHRHFLNKKFAITLVILILLGSGAYAGIWYWGNQQVAQEVVPTFTPRPSALPDPTADWKTYTNTKYGFEVRDPYPVGSSKVVGNKFEVRFDTPPGETRAVITIESSNQTAQQWYESFAKTPDFPVAQHIIISGEPAIRIDTNEWGLSLVGVQHSGYFFLFDGNMIEPLLSTFKFTDSTVGVFCGGIAGKSCPSGYDCKLDGNYPDAGGTCILSSNTSTLTGHVTVGPNCPVEQAGNPCTPAPQAYTSRQVMVYKADGTTLVTTQNFDTQGNYNIALPAGTYVVKSKTGISSIVSVVGTITIKIGQTSTLNFSIDTGIR